MAGVESLGTDSKQMLQQFGEKPNSDIAAFLKNVQTFLGEFEVLFVYLHNISKGCSNFFVTNLFVKIVSHHAKISTIS